MTPLQRRPRRPAARATRVVAAALRIASLLLAVVAAGQTVVPPDAGDGPRILSIEPATADPGERIVLTLSAPPAPDSKVYFGPIPAASSTVRDDTIIAVVPEGLPPRGRPMVVVQDPQGRSGQPSFDFEVAPLRIVVTPTSARPGETVLVKAQRPLEQIGREGSGTRLRVAFGGHEAEILRVSRAALEVVVPASLENGSQPDVVLFVGDVASEPFRDLTVASSLWQLSSRALSWSAPLVLAALALLAWWQTRRRRRLLESLSHYGTEPPEPESELELPPPAVPNELVDRCARGDCVLVAGAGLSARAGYPTWQALVGLMVGWARNHNYLDQERAKLFSRSLQGDPNAVADGLLDRLSGRESEVIEFLETVFHGDDPGLPKAHRELGKVPFAAVLTTNFDDLVERAFARRRPKVYTPRDFELLLDTFSRPEFYVLKLNGDLDRPETLTIAPAQYHERVQRSDFLRDFNEKLFFDRSLLFLGLSFAGIEDFLEGIGSNPRSRRRHFALVAVSEHGWEARAEVLERRYGIEVIPFPVRPDYPEVDDFVRTLARRVRADEAWDETPAEAAPARIERVELRNIGPFEHLELDLDPHMTILLGDNGVGKSTVLKAVAVAVAGKAAERYAERFIKAGEEQAEITIRTSDRQVYTTELLRTRHGVEMRSRPRRPFADGQTLVLGFPPLRTVAWRSPEAPHWVDNRESPQAADVLPIITNDPDPRITDLNQWFLNLDYLRTKRSDVAWVGRLFDSFFTTLRHLLGGMEIHYDGIDPERKQIMFRTDDGKVPLDLLSQGTVSVIGWIGVFLQRLYEIYDWSENLSQRYVLVLIDELDAHMHPEWQQELVGKMLDLFTSLRSGRNSGSKEPVQNIADCQFLVTTHSPFIVAGREADQIVRLRRDPSTRKVVAELPDRGTRGQGVSSILTSSLFSLETELDPQTQELIIERRRLTAQTGLDEVQRRRLGELNDDLQAIDVQDLDPLTARALRAMEERDSRRRAARLPLTRAEERALQRAAEETLSEIEEELGA